MIDGKIKGYFLLGQNPAVGSAHGRAQRLGMANLDWLVVRDLFMIESATFWKNGPEVATGEIVPAGVPHRGVLPAGRLARGEGGHVHPDPAAAAVAGEGRRAAGRRPLRAVVLLPPRAQAAGEAGRLAAAARPGAARPGLGLPDARPARRAERRGGAARDQRVRRRDRPPAGRLRRGPRPTAPPRSAAGSTPACTPTASTRRPAASPGHEQDWVAAEWGWAWPANRRILYNRASADPEGRPWSERKKYVWWDADEGRVDRLRRAGLREDQTAVVPAAARRVRDGGDRRRRPVHHAGRRQGLAVRAQRRPGRPAADALRAGRVAGAQPALRPAGQPDPQGLRRTR